jgi:PAS domain S-box-containing protein
MTREVVRVPGWTTRRFRKIRRDLAAGERALAESSERYRSLFAYNPHAAFSLDPFGQFTDANQVAQDLSGYSLEELRRMNFTRLITSDDVPLTLDAFHDVLDRQPRKLEASMLHRDGHVIEMNLTAVPVIVGGEVVGVHGIAEDITENNELRRDLERTRRLAEEASATKSLFLANMSHEVRTPLTGLLGAAELLTDSDLDDRQVSLVDMVQRSGEKLLRLVSDILDFSRIEAGKVDLQADRLSLHSLVDEAAGWCESLAQRKGLAFTWTVSPELPDSLFGDAMRISQVLTNLLENGLKFTEQGSVTLAVDSAGDQGDVVQVRFVVEDSGIGIPEDQLSTLFQPFTQADASTTRKYGGAGLGLTICRELVSLMGGTIEAQSVPGSGSTFSVTLPLRRVCG